jgi:hypothetical protein
MRVFAFSPFVVPLAVWILGLQTQAPPSSLHGALPPEAIRQIEAVMADKASRSPAQRKIASTLLYAAKRERGQPIALGVLVTRGAVERGADGLVAIDIRADVTSEVLERIEASGGVVVNSVPGLRSVRARLPLDRLEAIAALSEVASIGPADEAMTHRRHATPGDVRDQAANKLTTSQGDAAHRAAETRAAYGLTGAGIGIGVLSDGVDTLGSRQASGDLPAVTVLSGQAGSGDEGTAMLEIVHDLAPGATLFFATAFSGQAQFAANIQSLCAAGAHVIVDDVFYVAESAFQDGIVSQGVNAAVAAGCVYFTSAGNSGNLNDGTSGAWEGDFATAATNPPGLAAGDTAHDFGGGNNSNRVTLDSANSFTLQWSDPRGGSSNDYDLYLFNPTLTAILDLSTSSQTGSQDPFENISSSGFNDLNNRLVIVRNGGAAGRFLHLSANRGRFELATSGQTSGHSAAMNAVGVAAVNVGTAGGGAFVGGSSNPVETFSSDGPRRIFYDSSGAAITPGNFLSTGGQLLDKPDVAAADCVSTSTPGFSTFCGTSAAAPHAAALGALVLQAAGGPGSLTPAAVVQRLKSTALDIEAGGIDRDSGSGIVMTSTAVEATLNTFTDDPIVPGTTVVRATHLAQLRHQVNLRRSGCGLAAFAFSDLVFPERTVTIKAAHVSELRAALTGAYEACDRTPPAFTDDALGAGTVVKAVHLNELRAAVIALP